MAQDVTRRAAPRFRDCGLARRSLWLALGLALSLSGCGDDDTPRRQTVQADGWVLEGDAQAVSRTAFRLGDNEATVSRLYRVFPLTPGTYTLDFDLQNLLAATIPVAPFALPDVFFASLVTLDDATPFDPRARRFEAPLGLLDAEATGITQLNGSVTPSPRGPTWRHYTLTFLTARRVLVPVFELVDLNFLTNDSTVRLENIRLEPSTPRGPVVMVDAPSQEPHRARQQ